MSSNDEPLTLGGPAGRPELPPACAAVDADLAELALGALTGKDRVTALAHLETCARCATEVEQLSAAADQLLALAPSAEPPVGFEADVFSRLGLQPESLSPLAPALAALGPSRLTSVPRPGGPGRWRSQWARVVAAGIAAAVLFVAGVAVAGGLGAAPSRDQASGPIRSATLVADGHDVGDVMVYAGSPTWLFMYMDDGSWTGTLHCEVALDQGRTLALGRFWLSDGKGAWAASTVQPAGRLAKALIVGAHGQVLAQAQLS